MIGDVNESEYRGQIAMFHGFSQSQDVFFEMALQFALNGFLIHLIDFEGYGYSGGPRVSGLSIGQMHSQITSLLTQARPDLPLFILAHSMGNLILNTYLHLNKEVAAKLAGVILSAPFFGIPDFANFDAVKKQMCHLLKGVFENFALTSGMPLHKVTRNKQYLR